MQSLFKFFLRFSHCPFPNLLPFTKTVVLENCVKTRLTLEWVRFSFGIGFLSRHFYHTSSIV